MAYLAIISQSFLVRSSVTEQIGKPPRDCPSGCELYYKINSLKKYRETLRNEAQSNTAMQATSLAASAITQEGYNDMIKDYEERLFNGIKDPYGIYRFAVFGKPPPFEHENIIE